MGELTGISHSIYLLQSSIQYCSQMSRLPSDMIVYRGIAVGGLRLAPLYHSMVREVIVLPSFTSISKKRNYVIKHFIEDEDSILFEIMIHPGDIAACVHNYSEFPTEFEILIAATSGFIVESVEMLDIEKENRDCLINIPLPLIKISYCLSWFDFDIDECPSRILL
jgi:hypothetical protein